MSSFLRTKINSGGFGDIYKIETSNTDENKKEKYAVKVIRNNFYGIRCFLEILIVLFLQYSHIAHSPQYYVDTVYQTTKILMPLAISDLRVRMIKTNSVLSRTKFRDISWQISCAIGYLHHKGILHGDIKPSNILVYKEGIRLSDFSLSSIQLYPEYRIIGKDAYTEQYRPPEIWAKKGYTYKADSWALGCTLYELHYRKKYFPSEKDECLENEKDSEIKHLLLSLLEIDEGKRIDIWKVLSLPFFEENRKKEPITFPLQYPMFPFLHEFDFANFLQKKIGVYDESIPYYVFEIIAAKLIRKSIDKENSSLFTEEFYSQEAKVLQILSEKNIGYELFVI